MESETALKRPLPVLSSARLERLQARVPLLDLSAATGIPLVVLSEAERGLRELTPAQAERRRNAIERLAVRGRS
jgi:hypothetical protein